MKVIQASYEILTDLSDPIKILKDIERASKELDYGSSLQ